MIKSVLSKSRRKACWGFWEIPRQGFFRSGCDWEHMVKTLLERHYCEVIWEMTLWIAAVCAGNICCAVISLLLFFSSHETCLCYQGQQQNASLCQTVPSFTLIYNGNHSFHKNAVVTIIVNHKIIINHYSEPCQFCVFMFVLFCV